MDPNIHLQHRNIHIPHRNNLPPQNFQKQPPPPQQQQQNIDLDILTKQIATAPIYEEFQEDFPNALKRTLWNSILFAHRHKLIERSAYQERLFIPLARTAVFDIYNQFLATSALFHEKNKKEKPIELILLSFNHKCLYYKYALDVILDCKELISVGGNKFECPTLKGDPSFQMLNLTKMLLKRPLPLDSEGPPRPNFKDPNQFFEIDNLHWLFFQRFCLKIRNLKKMIERNGAFSIDKSSDEALTDILQKVGIWASGATNAFLEWNVISKLAEGHSHYVFPISRLILLDTLVKIQSDLGWLISNHLILDDFGVKIPFIISEVCQSLEPYSFSIIKTYNIKPNTNQQHP